jgi:hypothetical protein
MAQATPSPRSIFSIAAMSSWSRSKPKMPAFLRMRSGLEELRGDEEVASGHPPGLECLLDAGPDARFIVITSAVSMCR